MINFLDKLYPYCEFNHVRKEGDLLLLTNNNLELIYLNETALSFIEKIDNNSTLEEILENLFKEYNVEKEILVNDIYHLIRDLQWKGVLFFSKKPVKDNKTIKSKLIC